MCSGVGSMDCYVIKFLFGCAKAVRQRKLLQAFSIVAWVLKVCIQKKGNSIRSITITLPRVLKNYHLYKPDAGV